MMKKKAVGFSATAQIKRSDFGITYGIPNVPDEVDLEIQAEAQVK
jgi:polyisoprenoid-binding protein YceI